MEVLIQMKRNELPRMVNYSPTLDSAAKRLYEREMLSWRNGANVCTGHLTPIMGERGNNSTPRAC